ncbi:MAG: hypothetical protein V4813_10370 [Gemmatimonadota bacterium]
MPLPRACLRALPLVTLALVACGLAQPAEAQLGALRRAAERRVEQKAEDRVASATLIPPVFDNTTLELTAERLDRYTAAMETLKRTRAQNRRRYDAMQGQISEARDAAQRAENPAERQAYERSTDRYRDCRNDVVEAIEKEVETQMQQVMQRMQSDPMGAQRDPKVKEMQAGMNAVVAAQQSGDTVAVRRATARMQAAMGMVTDSAAIDRKAVAKCGARPARPRSVVLADSLSKRATALQADANALISTSGGVKGSEVGMTDVQARMVWERIQSWLNGVQDSAPITRTFSKSEYDLLLARRGALRKAFANSE